MGCTNSTALAEITYSCDDKPKGGISQIYVARKENADGGVIASGVLTYTTGHFTPDDVIEIDFNKKDGFTIAGTEYSGENDGTDSYVPTISVEAPRVTVDKLLATELMSGGFNELVVYVKHRTGLWFAYGTDNGVFISAGTTTTGTNTDKNILQITFTGEEDSYEKSIDDTSIGFVEEGLSA